jgi:hypothetical protein
MGPILKQAAPRTTLYTAPSPPVPGDTLTVFYNQAATVLAGEERVVMHAGFNNWSQDDEMVGATANTI